MEKNDKIFVIVTFFILLFTFYTQYKIFDNSKERVKEVKIQFEKKDNSNER